MTELLYFLGRFHVLVLHLPVGILLLAAALEVASRRERFHYLAPAVGTVWFFGAISAIAAAVLGYFHALEGGFDGAAVNAHRIAGTSLAIVAAATWLLRAWFQRAYAWSWPVWSIAVVALLFVTGHFGGNLTHGDTYLVQYAPAGFRHLMGVSDEQMPRAKPKDLASADIYLDVVAPALRQRCSSCHNDGKRKGGLSLASYATLMKGGEHGAVVAAGKPEASDLVRRISLSPDDKDFMPHDGKTPLSAEQTAAIRWWVAVGAPKSGALTTLKPPVEVSANLAAVLGLGEASPKSVAKSSLVSAPAVGVPMPMPDARVVDALESNGFVVRAISLGSPLLQVDYTAGRRIAAADIENLGKIGKQIYALNLRAAGVTDDQLATIGRFENMARLRLELNPLTDAGLHGLAPLKKLEYLNLYGTKVTDKGLASLAALESLRELFLWQTAVTPAAIAEFRRAHARVAIDAGFDPKTFPEGPKAIPVVN